MGSSTSAHKVAKGARYKYLTECPDLKTYPLFLLSAIFRKERLSHFDFWVSYLFSKVAGILMCCFLQKGVIVVQSDLCV